ncbi:hypothetical protein SBA5_320028 [Candidatus Sulfotelmatomonas gaucii]|uniref:Uncharacterized protein n=1 Tax=Candidatus Sulfuritelmatomonas gaucii TaxID=2043161 RepID=A0A2N9LEJ0_9BACT|nr:hypothetical protein SBA5_320028 [Candidatus Sulfotelmatomonas gaucii]
MPAVTGFAAVCGCGAGAGGRHDPSARVAQFRAPARFSGRKTHGIRAQERSKTRQNEAQNRVLEDKKMHLIHLSRNYMVRFALIPNLRWLQIA